MNKLYLLSALVAVTQAAAGACWTAPAELPATEALITDRAGTDGDVPHTIAGKNSKFKLVVAKVTPAMIFSGTTKFVSEGTYTLTRSGGAASDGAAGTAVTD